MTQEEIESLLRARTTLLWIPSKEEQRAEAVIIDAAGAAGYEAIFWDCATGLTNAMGEPIDATAIDPQKLLNRIRANDKRQLWVLRDYHRWMSDNFPTTTRGLKSLARDLENASDPARLNAVAILCPISAPIPPDLDGVAVPVVFPMPEREDMMTALEDTLEGLDPDKQSTIRLQERLKDPGAKDAIVGAVLGLTVKEAENCWAKSRVMCKGDINTKVLITEKKRLVRGTGIVWVDPDPRGLDAVGGYEEAKEWAMTRKLAFSEEARKFGLPPAKGVLLAGVPGCGKSLLAKCLATAWDIPLLMGDLGALMSKWVGESEANLRVALERAEAIAPCIILFDEFEKMVAGSSGDSDSGVAARALGYLLRWMQEHTAPVFVVATVNDVDKLPAELCRKGRFDELFFVDLPNQQEREAVMEASLRQYKRDPELIDVTSIADCTDGFSGAEIAALVPEAMFVAFKEGRDIRTEDLCKAASETTPLSKTSGQRIQKIREWATKTGARSASSKPKTTRSKGRAIDVD